MKKIIFIISIPLILILLAALGVFLKPELVINQKNLEWALNRWSPYEQTIKVFEFRHTRHSFLKREIEILLEDLHLKNNEQSDQDDQMKVDIHLKKMEFSFLLFWSENWKVESHNLNTIVFENISLSLPEATSDEEKSESKDLIYLSNSYSLLWKDVIPDFELIIHQLKVEKQNKLYELPLKIVKTKDLLACSIHELELMATPRRFALTIKKPHDLWTLLQFFPNEEFSKELRDLELSINFDIKEDNHPLLIKIEAFEGDAQIKARIPDKIDLNQTNLLIENIFSTLEIQAGHPRFAQTLLPYLDEQTNKNAKELKAKIETRLVGQKASSGEMAFEIKSQIDLEINALELELQHTTQATVKTQAVLEGDMSLLSSVLLGTQIELTIDQLHKKWEKLEDKLLQLPAPLNSLDGELKMKLAFQKGEDLLIEALLETNLDLKGHQQDLVLKTKSLIALETQTLTPVGALQTEIELERVNLRLPRWQAQANTPQFMPDSRIILPSQTRSEEKLTTDKSQTLEIDLHLKTDKKRPMTIGTNLLERPIRFNFDIQIEKGIIKEGYVEVLPLELEIFRRKIVLNNLRVNFLAPALPELKAQISFHLPQYLITLNLEGTTDQIRHHFSSTPPLPQSDIYAVLLFGRPMTDLSEGDRAASNQTQQLLSDGILSLSLLYFLSGGPIESIGFNPDTGSVSAQVGISQKSSLTLSTSASGENSASVRRSLGRGWYIDTSVENNNQMPHGAQQDYGVLLEKIMAY